MLEQALPVHALSSGKAFFLRGGYNKIMSTAERGSREGQQPLSAQQSEFAVGSLPSPAAGGAGLIASALIPLRRRLLARVFLRWYWAAALSVDAALVATLWVRKPYLPGAAHFELMGAALFAPMAVAVVRCLAVRLPLAALARLIDERGGLQERVASAVGAGVGTAEAVHPVSSRMLTLLYQDALSALASVDAPRILPLKRDAIVAGVALAITLSLFFWHAPEVIGMAVSGKGGQAGQPSPLDQALGERHVVQASPNGGSRTSPASKEPEFKPTPAERRAATSQPGSNSSSPPTKRQAAPQNSSSSQSDQASSAKTAGRGSQQMASSGKQGQPSSTANSSSTPSSSGRQGTGGQQGASSQQGTSTQQVTGGQQASSQSAANHPVSGQPNGANARQGHQPGGTQSAGANKRGGAGSGASSSKPGQRSGAGHAARTDANGASGKSGKAQGSSKSGAPSQGGNGGRQGGQSGQQSQAGTNSHSNSRNQSGKAGGAQGARGQQNSDSNQSGGRGTTSTSSGASSDQKSSAQQNGGGQAYTPFATGGHGKPRPIQPRELAPVQNRSKFSFRLPKASNGTLKESPATQRVQPNQKGSAASSRVPFGPGQSSGGASDGAPQTSDVEQNPRIPVGYRNLVKQYFAGPAGSGR